MIKLRIVYAKKMWYIKIGPQKILTLLQRPVESISPSLESETIVTTLTHKSTTKWSLCGFKTWSEKVMQFPLGSLETLAP